MLVKSRSQFLWAAFFIVPMGIRFLSKFPSYTLFKNILISPKYTLTFLVASSGYMIK